MQKNRAFNFSILFKFDIRNPAVSFQINKIP